MRIFIRNTIIVLVIISGCFFLYKFFINNDVNEIENKFVIVELGNLTPEGSFNSCLQRRVQLGYPIELALKECDYRDTVWGSTIGGGSHGGAIGIGIGTEGEPNTNVDCSNAGNINPLYAEGDTRPAKPEEKEQYDLDSTQLMYTEEGKKRKEKELLDEASFRRQEVEKTPEYKAYEKAMQKWDALPPGPEKDQAHDNMEKLWEEVEKTSEGKEYLNAVKDLIHFQSHPYTPPLLSRPDPNQEAVNACQELNSFIIECNARHWKTSECQLFLSQMNGCGDPRVTDPSPEGDATCRLPRVDPAVAEEVAFIACMSTKKPAPGEEPCKPLEAHGIMTRYFFAGSGSQVCENNPIAYLTEPCSRGTINLITLGEPDLIALQIWLQKRFGTPVFVFPTKNPRGPKTGPNPNQDGTWPW